jgi:hypothetical protein
VLGRCWQKLGKRTAILWLCAMLGLPMMGCSQLTSAQKVDAPMAINADARSQIEEVSPPEILQQLSLELEQYDPQVKILGLEPDQTLADTAVSLRLQVKDFPLYKDAKLGLGPHLHVLLDDQPSQTLYDTDEALNFQDLSPGTHTIRAFAVRPWDESFKTAGALAQVTFHVFAPTQANRPDPTQPLLTYNNPQGEYGTEPIMLDYSVALPTPKSEGNSSISPWKVRISLNGQSFTTSEAAPIYLKGFKPGVNWLKLELLNASGKPVANAFGETVRLITLKPNGKDTLSQLMRGELTAQEAERIVSRKISKRLTAQEEAAQEEEEALAAEAKQERAKRVAPAPETSINRPVENKPVEKPIETVPIQVVPRSPSPNKSPSEAIAKPVSPAIPSRPMPASAQKAITQPSTPKAQAQSNVPLWSKIKSSLFSDKPASESRPESARAIPSQANLSHPEGSSQAAPPVSPSTAPPKTTTSAGVEPKPNQIAEPIPTASPQLDTALPSVPTTDQGPLDSFQKFLDFQSLNTKQPPVLQQKTAVQIPSRYLQKSQQPNQSVEADFGEAGA